MEFTKNMHNAMERAVILTQQSHHRYFLPEHILYGITFDEDFGREFAAAGGKIEQLRKNLMEFLSEHAETVKEDKNTILSSDMERVLLLSEGQARSSGRRAVGVSHVLSALLQLEDSYALYFLLIQEVDLLELIGDLSRESLQKERGIAEDGPANSEAFSDKEAEIPGFLGDSAEQEGPSPGNARRWRRYVEAMGETCRKQNPLIGREEELERTIQILCRKDKNNVLHLGEPGVGKTAIAYGLAQRILDGQVPEPLLGASLYSLDLGGLLAGTQYRGDFEKRFKEIMEGLAKEEKPILYLDEIHNIVGAGAVNGGSLDAANLLKPYLAAGHIRFIGATTYEEYKKHFSGKKSLVRRFQNVDILEPGEEETVKILNGLKSGYEKFHGVKYGKGVLAYAAEVSRRYIHERFLPDKAIDLIDEAGAYRRLHPLEQKRQTVGKDLIELVLAKTCNIPRQTVEKGETEKLAVLEKDIRQQIFGQKEAVRQVADAVKFSRAGLNDEHKPIASFLFVGATGVGKTELAKVLAEELGISFLRFDMSEYAEKHTVAKLIGAPAGYVGYEEGGLLTEEVRRHPHAVLLLDEMEKAHPDIFNVLLQVMDYATLTDNQGRKADFRNIILIMTSNAGASQVGKSQIGFGSTKVNTDALMDAVNRTFSPEFRNRLSKIVLFNPMDDAMAERITEKKLNELGEKLALRNVEFSASPEAKVYIRNHGITAEYGAREIDRVITGEVKPLLAERLLFGNLKRGGKCHLEVREEKLVLC